MSGIDVQQAPSATKVLSGDVEETIRLLLEVAGVDTDRATMGGYLGAKMVMKRLEELGWRMPLVEGKP